MGKIITLAIIIGAAVWVYFNVDFANFKSNTIDTFKNEKTIKKFHNSEQQRGDQLNKTLDEGF